jgi:hypothetical protein
MLLVLLVLLCLVGLLLYRLSVGWSLRSSVWLLGLSAL